MNEIKKTTIFHAGQKQVVEIPAEFQLSDGEVTIRKDGDRVVIAPARDTTDAPKNWAEFLDGLEPLDIDWPDVDEGLLPVEDVNL